MAVASAMVGQRAATLAQRFNSPLGVAALTTLAYVLYFLTRLLFFHGDITRFVLAGSDYIPSASGAAVGLSVASHSGGYDGQFYYLLALDPFSPQPALSGAHFDIPAYRAQRILYPFLAWALSLGGRPALVPIMLVAVNLAAIIAIGWLAATLAERQGAQPIWGLLLALYPGLLLSLARDLAEPLAIALALAALLFARDRRWGWAAVALSLAVLARETTALIAVACLVIAAVDAITRVAPRLEPIRRFVVCERQDDSCWPGAWVTGASPLLVAAIWQGVLLAHWGRLGIFAAGANNISFPLLGLVEGFAAWHMLWSPPLQLMHYLAVLYLVGLAEAARRLIMHERRGGLLAIAWGCYFLLALCLSVFVWDYLWNFLRGAMELAMLSLLLLMATSPRWRAMALAATATLWLVTFIVSAPPMR